MFSYLFVGWVLVTESVAITRAITFSKLEDVDGKTQLICSLKINEDFTWTVVMNGRDVSITFSLCPLFRMLSTQLIAKYSSLKDDSFMNAQGNVIVKL